MKATELQKQKMREYYIKNKEKFKERRRRHYSINRVSICMRMREVRKGRGKELRERTLELHPLKDIHSALLERCGIRKCSNAYVLSAYAGRGITVCDEWKDSKTFEKWCLDNGWKKGLQIDRIDNDKGYSQNNCRFVSPKENCRNRRSNRIVEYNGEKRPLAYFVENGNTKLGYDGTRRRIARGWCIKEAFETERVSNQYRKEFNHVK